MMQHEDIELIEKSFKGKLTPDEEIKLRENLDSSEEFKLEFEAYTKLFKGLKGMELSETLTEITSFENVASPSDEKIEQFLSGKLSAKEEEEFQNHLKSDPELSDRTDQIKKTLQGLKQLEIEDFISEVNEWEDEAREMSEEKGEDTASDTESKLSDRPTFKIRRLYMAVASAAAIGLLLFIGYRSVTPGYTSSSLADMSYEEPVYTGIRGDEEDNPARDGLALIKTQQWAQAEAILSGVTRGRYFEKAQLYLSHLYYQRKNYQKALSIIRILMDSNDSSVQQDASWLFIVNSMQANVWSEEHQEILSGIAADEENPYNEKAKQLLQKRSTIWFKMVN